MRSMNSIFVRLVSMTFLISVTCTIASAYTLVLYGGKRVEIPYNFVVTSNAVIYEAAPNMNISYLLKSIDVPATERANNDSAGSFLGRTSAHPVEAPRSTTATQKATRTITNRDLEPYETARLRSEAAWEERRKDLSLPSVEEARREAARRDEALDQFLEKKRVEQQAIRRQEFEDKLLLLLARTNTPPNQEGQNYWPGGSFLDSGGSGAFDSNFRNGRRFPSGSPCGFNPSASCLMSHPSSLFNQGTLPTRRSFFVAPRTTVGGRRGGGHFVSPGRRR